MRPSVSSPQMKYSLLTTIALATALPTVPNLAKLSQEAMELELKYPTRLSEFSSSANPLGGVLERHEVRMPKVAGKAPSTDIISTGHPKAKVIQKSGPELSPIPKAKVVKSSSPPETIPSLQDFQVPKPKRFPLVDPPFEQERIEISCTNCLPRTGHAMGAPIRHQKVYRHFNIPGLTNHELYFTIKDLQSTITAADNQIYKLQRIKTLMNDIPPSDPLYIWKPQNIILLDQDITKWAITKETATSFLEIASKSASEKTKFTNEILTEIKDNFITKKPLVRPDYLSFPIGQDIIRLMRQAIAE
jgi:hypothetical protein